MTEDTLRQALAATARVACAVALVGCVPKAAAPADPVDGVEDGAAETSAVEISAPAAENAAAEEEVSLAECDAHLEEAFDGRRAASDPKTTECCEGIAEHYDSVSLKGMESWETRFDCCELLGWQGSMACTPWGPPCPPAMPTA